MKIAFICGSIEPGFDGVGDYTRRLAGEVMRKGHEVIIVALYDKHITGKSLDVQYGESGKLLVHRLPYIWSEQDRLEKTKLWIDEFDPEWLSLQFVIYAFHEKGLPFGLTKKLSKLGRRRKWHIMFHELWVGMALNDAILRIVLGKIQKLIIQSLITKLHPLVIHSQCDLFIEQLKREKYQVRKLPLFSNIKSHNKALIKNDCYKHLLGNGCTIKFILFGGIHPHAKLHELISKLKDREKANFITFEFIYIGRNGHELNNHLSILNNENIKYSVMGELDPECISQLLSSSSYGVSTTSPEVLEKSGTVAAMISHGLPVISIGRQLKLRGNFEANPIEGIYFLEDVEQILKNRPSINTVNTLSNVTISFINDINSVSES